MLMGYIKQKLLLHADHGLPSLILKVLDYIKIMTNAVKKYEEVLKCLEMISNGMLPFITCLACHASQDSFVCIVTNWIILGF